MRRADSRNQSRRGRGLVGGDIDRPHDVRFGSRVTKLTLSKTRPLNTIIADIRTDFAFRRSGPDSDIVRGPSNGLLIAGNRSWPLLGNRHDSRLAQQLLPIVSPGPLGRAIEEFSGWYGEREANAGSQKAGRRAFVTERHVADPERQKVKQIGAVGALSKIRQRSPRQYP